MQKPLAYSKKGLSGDNSINTTIVPERPTNNQVLLEISKYLERRQFTKAFDVLEKHGIAGNVALFLLANLQNMEVF